MMALSLHIHNMMALSLHIHNMMALSLHIHHIWICITVTVQLKIKSPLGRTGKSASLGQAVPDVCRIVMPSKC